MDTTRPKLKIELTPVDRFFESIGWLTLSILWIWTLLNFANLPDIIPMHFNAAGEPDGVGSKWTIFMLPTIATVLFVGMTFLNKYPHVFNYPTNITNDNAAKQYRNATRLIRYLKFTLVLIFSTIVFKTIQTAAGKSDGLGNWFIPMTLGLVFIPLTIFIIKSYKTK